jgi:SHS2 domain-containing protein
MTMSGRGHLSWDLTGWWNGKVSRGHRTQVAVEAWADSREECLAEAVHALVESFADFGEVVPDDSVAFAVVDECDEELLLSVLDEAIYQVRAYGRVTVDVSVDERTGATRGQVEVRLATISLERVDQVGTVPEAVSVNGLRFGQEAGMWRAHVVPIATRWAAPPGGGNGPQVPGARR